MYLVTSFCCNALCFLRCLILVHFKDIAAGCLVSCTVNLKLQLSCGNLFAVSYVYAYFRDIFLCVHVCTCGACVESNGFQVDLGWNCCSNLFVAGHSRMRLEIQLRFQM